MKKPRILIYDIEMAPNIGTVWGMWKVNVSKILRYKYIMSFSYKWLGDKKITHIAQPHFKSYYKKNPYCDKKVVEALWKLIDEADIVMAHNGNSFDLQESRARFAYHDMKPYREVQKIDSKLMARATGKFVSNSLDNLCDYFKIGRKLPNAGIDMWVGCMEGNKKSWKEMEKYNNHDVTLMEPLYKKLRPWINNHPNVAQIQGKSSGCPTCGSKNLKKWGFRYTAANKYQRYICGDCGCPCKDRLPYNGAKKPDIVS